MGYYIPANCVFLDRHHGCKHPNRRRSSWNPLRWVGLDRPACVFAVAEFSRDGRDGVMCSLQQEVPRGPPPSGGTSGVKR